MRFLKYSLPVLCLLLAECTSVSGHKEKERLTMAEYKHPSDDMQPREECSPAPQPKKSAMALYMDSQANCVNCNLRFHTHISD